MFSLSGLVGAGWVLVCGCFWSCGCLFGLWLLVCGVGGWAGWWCVGGCGGCL